MEDYSVLRCSDTSLCSYSSVMPVMLCSDVTASPVLQSSRKKSMACVKIGADYRCYSVDYKDNKRSSTCTLVDLGKVWPGSFSGAGHRELLYLKRELSIREEYDRLRREDEGRHRIEEQCSRQRETLLGQQSLLETAMKLEEVRAKREEEQRQRLFDQEKQLEEWKQQRAQELERDRRRRLEEEDRLREREHEREMQRLHEEAKMQLQVQRDASEYGKRIEQAVETANSAMAHQILSELQDREGERRAEANQQYHACKNEIAALRQEMECKQHILQRNEKQLLESQAHLMQVMEQLNELRRLLNSSSEKKLSDAALADVFQRNMERLQRSFDEDKTNMKQWFDGELQRLVRAHDRERSYDEEKHNAQLRIFEKALEEQQHRQRESDEELRRCRAKAATADNVVAEESRLREELRMMRMKLQDASSVEERLTKKASEADRAASEARRALHTVQTEFQLLSDKQTAELRAVREEKQELADELARTKAAHIEEIQQIRENLTVSDNASSRELSKDYESFCKRITEHHEEALHALEREKGHLARQLRDAEKQLETSQRQLLVLQERMGEEKRNNDRLWQQQIAERDLSITSLKNTIEHLKVGGESVAQLAAQNHDLQVQLEKKDRDLQAALSNKDGNIQQLVKEQEQSQQSISQLRQELGMVQRMRDEEKARADRISEEASLKEKQLRQEIDDAMKTVDSWKSHCSQLLAEQAAAATSSKSNVDSLIREKDNEIEQIRNSLLKSNEENKQLIQKFEKAHERNIAMEKELMEKNALSAPLDRRSSDVQSALQKESAQDTGTPPPKSMQPRASGSALQPVVLSVSSVPQSLSVPVPPEVVNPTPAVPIVSPPIGLSASHAPVEVSVASAVLSPPPQVAPQVVMPVPTIVNVEPARSGSPRARALGAQLLPVPAVEMGATLPVLPSPGFFPSSLQLDGAQHTLPVPVVAQDAAVPIGVAPAETITTPSIDSTSGVAVTLSPAVPQPSTTMTNSLSVASVASAQLPSTEVPTTAQVIPLQAVTTMGFPASTLPVPPEVVNLTPAVPIVSPPIGLSASHAPVEVSVASAVLSPPPQVAPQVVMPVPTIVNVEPARSGSPRARALGAQLLPVPAVEMGVTVSLPISPPPALAPSISIPMGGMQTHQLGSTHLPTNDAAIGINSSVADQKELQFPKPSTVLSAPTGLFGSLAPDVAPIGQAPPSIPVALPPGREQSGVSEQKPSTSTKIPALGAVPDLLSSKGLKEGKSHKEGTKKTKRRS